MVKQFLLNVNSFEILCIYSINWHVLFLTDSMQYNGLFAISSSISGASYIFIPLCVQPTGKANLFYLCTL